MVDSVGQSREKLRHVGVMVVAALAALGGAAALIRPFVATCKGWEWPLRGEENLAGAIVNADHAWEGEGITLRRKTERDISLISAPMQLPPQTSSTVRVRTLIMKGSYGRSPARIQVRFIWQTGAGQSYKFEARELKAEPAIQEIEFDLRDPPESIHRLGVQFPEAYEVCILGIDVPDRSPPERIESAIRQLSEFEPLENYSINFIRGPSILGHGINYYAVSFCGLLLGSYLLKRQALNQPVRFRPMLGLVFLSWMAADATAILRLTQQTRFDLTRFEGRMERDQILKAYGSDISWSHKALLEACRLDERYAVLSDDPFTPSRRLDYLLAPQRIRVDDPGRADWILLVHESRARFSADEGILQLPDGRAIRARMAKSDSDQLLLLERLGR